jgi:hypothetical protein
MHQVFAGPLCRLYARGGHDPAHLLSGITNWREELMAALGNKPKLPAAWSEDPRGDVCTADPGASGFIALQLFAHYAEHSELELPDTVPALLELDRSFRTAVEAKFATSKFGHLLACRTWLPGDFPFTCRVPLPDGEMGEIGSLSVLHDQLKFLNARTFQADASVIAAWLRQPAPPGGALLPAAQRGFAAMWAVVGWAAVHGLPVVVRLG